MFHHVVIIIKMRTDPPQTQKIGISWSYWFEFISLGFENVVVRCANDTSQLTNCYHQPITAHVKCGIGQSTLNTNTNCQK